MDNKVHTSQKTITELEQSEPTGVIPLQGCRVGIAPPSSQVTIKHVFILTLPEQLVGLGIIKRTNYVLAAHDNDDLHSWIGTIQLASISKRKLQAKVEHAYMEVRDLEQRWAISKERDASREAGMALAPLKSQGEEDPVILQALADALMDAYHTRELIQNAARMIFLGCLVLMISLMEIYPSRIKDAQARSQEAYSHLTKIERAASMQEEMILAREDLGYLMSDIQSDMAACSESLEWLIPARFHFYTIERQVEALEGLCEGGEGVPSSLEIEAILRETLKNLEDLEFQYKGDEMLPDEKTIAQLGAQLASIYEEYMSILQCAIGSLQEKQAFAQNFIEEKQSTFTSPQAFFEQSSNFQ